MTPPPTTTVPPWGIFAAASLGSRSCGPCARRDPPLVARRPLPVATLVSSCHRCPNIIHSLAFIPWLGGIFVSVTHPVPSSEAVTRPLSPSFPLPSPSPFAALHRPHCVVARGAAFARDASAVSVQHSSAGGSSKAWRRLAAEAAAAATW